MFLKQEIEEKYYEYSIFEYIKEVTKIKELESTLDKLSLDLTEDKIEEYTLLYNEFLSLDGYNFESNLEIIKNGLNLRASLNTKIKTLKRISFGFRNFTNFRLRVLMACS